MLPVQANTYSSNLSGGQKRKLSVGIALIGDSKIVFLVRTVCRVSFKLGVLLLGTHTHTHTTPTG